MTAEIRWKNVYSRTVVYREILRIGYLSEKAEPKLQKALMDYLSQIADHVKYLDEFRVDEQPDEELEPLDRVLLKSLGVGKYRLVVNERIILDGLEKTVSDSEGVILYGAGKVGKLFYHFLKKRNLGKKVLCYAVSRKPAVSVSPDGIKVLPVEEAVKKPGLIFLSVVGHDMQKEMKKTLYELGIDHFEIFDQYMYRALRHEIKRMEERGKTNGCG